MVPGGLFPPNAIYQKVWYKVKSENIFLGFVGILHLITIKTHSDTDEFVSKCSAPLQFGFWLEYYRAFNEYAEQNKALVNGLPQIPSLVLAGSLVSSIWREYSVNQVLKSKDPG